MAEQTSRALRWIKATALAAGAAAVVTSGTATGVPSVAEANIGLFKSLKGRWSGSGSINFSDGEKEPLRCRVTYFVSGGSRKLAQTIRCASDGFIIEVKSNFKASGSRISGAWKETTSNIKGTISGRSTANGLRLTIRGRNFTSSMVIAKNGTRQSVSISSNGGKVSRVSMNLRKG